MTRRRIVRSLLGAMTLAVFLFMLAPVLVVVFQAFNDSPTSTFPLTGVTLRWFTALPDDPAIVGALRTSLALAAWASVLSTLIGTTAAYALARFRFRGRNFVQLLLTIPILVPHIVLGVGLLLAFRFVGLAKSFPLLIVGHIAITLPFVVLTTGHRLQAIPLQIEEAARTLGANRLQTFKAITLPLALPAILTSLMFAFMSSFDEVTATLFWLPANIETIPSHIMAMLQFSVDQKINSLASALILGSVGLAFVTVLASRALSADARLKRGPRT
jgi:spermidine/putrescine transport system permease protein